MVSKKKNEGVDKVNPSILAGPLVKYGKTINV
jgi:hypothetical protein